MIRGVLLARCIYRPPAPTELEFPRWDFENTMETSERLYRAETIFHPAAKIQLPQNEADHVNETFETFLIKALDSNHGEIQKYYGHCKQYKRHKTNFYDKNTRK